MQLKNRISFQIQHKLQQCGKATSCATSSAAAALIPDWQCPKCKGGSGGGSSAALVGKEHAEVSAKRRQMERRRKNLIGLPVKVARVDADDDADDARDAGEVGKAQRCAVAAKPGAVHSGGSNAGVRGLSQARANEPGCSPEMPRTLSV